MKAISDPLNLAGRVAQGIRAKPIHRECAPGRRLREAFMPQAPLQSIRHALFDNI
jgi:hypothetical protein